MCQAIGEKLSEIGGRLDYPCLNKELAQDIETLWKDAAIQVAVASYRLHILIALHQSPIFFRSSCSALVFCLILIKNQVFCHFLFSFPF